jgi:hypothetical protein
MANGKPKSTLRTLTSMLLAFESFVVFFGLLGAFGMKVADGATVWAIGLTLSVVMILTPGVLGRPGSYIFGWVLQAITLGLSIAICVANVVIGPIYIIVSVIFVGLWSWAVIAGTTIDAARKSYLETQAKLEN